MLTRWTTVFLMLHAIPAYAALCGQWDAGKSIGDLPPKILPEASGMTASQNFSNRVYWINDSGDKGFFYYSDPSGKGMQKVKIANFKPRDTEAISIAACDVGACLAIADIGDNRANHKNIKVVFVREQLSYPDDAKILRTLTLTYPDGAHDAEAMAFLPDGQMWIVTKELRISQLSAAAAGVYSVAKADWSTGGDKELKLKKVGELPLPSILAAEFFPAQVATDMAFNSARQVLGVLTYGKVVEFPLKVLADLSGSSQWKKDVDYAIVPITALNQQESMTYLTDPDRIVWSSEYTRREAPIFSMTCTRPSP